MRSTPRIVSLLPSATEIVCALGLRDQLVGVSHECDYPGSVESLPKVTRTLIRKNLTSREIDHQVRDELQKTRALYSLDLALLARLEPDLIVTQALCDVCAVAAEEVEQAACHLPGGPKVLNLEPMSLEEVFNTLQFVGDAAGVSTRAAQIVAALRSRVAAVASRVPPGARPRVAFLEWLDPPFNGGHWTPEIIRISGGEDCFDGGGKASRTLAWGEVVAAEPDVLFIALCGFDIERSLLDIPTLSQLPGWDGLPCVRSGQVWLADGNQFFSRPGPRLVESLEMLAAVLHPDHQARPKDGQCALRIGPAQLRAGRLNSQRALLDKTPWPIG